MLQRISSNNENISRQKKSHKRESTGRPKNSLSRPRYTTDNSVRVFRWMCAQHVLRGVGFSRFLLSLHHIKRFIFLPECSVEASGSGGWTHKLLAGDFISATACHFFLPTRAPRQFVGNWRDSNPFFRQFDLLCFDVAIFPDEWDDDMFNLFMNVWIIMPANGL